MKLVLKVTKIGMMTNVTRFSDVFRSTVFGRS